jgi:hypothetical protein
MKSKFEGKYINLFDFEGYLMESFQKLSVITTVVSIQVNRLYAFRLWEYSFFKKYDDPGYLLNPFTTKHLIDCRVNYYRSYKPGKFRIKIKLTYRMYS